MARQGEFVGGWNLIQCNKSFLTNPLLNQLNSISLKLTENLSKWELRIRRKELDMSLIMMLVLKISNFENPKYNTII